MKGQVEAREGGRDVAGQRMCVFLCACVHVREFRWGKSVGHLSVKWGARVLCINTPVVT